MKASKSKNINQTEWLICKVLIDAAEGVGFARMLSDIGKICVIRDEKAPGKNMAEDARKALLDRGEITYEKVGGKHLYKANDKTRAIVNKGGE